MKNLGLDERESSIYLSLLEGESMSILELSRDTGIPRTTLYRIVDSLINKRFVEEEVHENGSKLVVKRPEELDFIVKEGLQELDGMKDALSSLKEVAEEITSTVPRTKVRYYKGIEGLQQMLWNSLKGSDVIGYSEFGRVDMVGKKFYEEYVKEFRFRGSKDRVVSNQKCLDYYLSHILSEENKHQLDKDGIKILDKEIFYVSGDTSIYNNVYAVSYWKGSEIVGVEIENDELVKLHRSIFEILWKQAKPIDRYL